MTLCPACGLQVHRYSPSHVGTPTNLMGCINSLLMEVDKRDREIERLQEQLRSSVPRRIARRILGGAS